MSVPIHQIQLQSKNNELIQSLLNPTQKEPKFNPTPLLDLFSIPSDTEKAEQIRQRLFKLQHLHKSSFSEHPEWQTLVFYLYSLRNPPPALVSRLDLFGFTQEQAIFITAQVLKQQKPKEIWTRQGKNSKHGQGVLKVLLPKVLRARGVRFEACGEEGLNRLL